MMQQQQGGEESGSGDRARREADAVLTKAAPSLLSASPVSLCGADLLLQQLHCLLQCLFSMGALQRLAIPCLEALEERVKGRVCSTFLPYLSPHNPAAVAAAAAAAGLQLSRRSSSSSSPRAALGASSPAAAAAAATPAAAGAAQDAEEEEESPSAASAAALSALDEGAEAEEQQLLLQQLKATDRQQTRTYSVLEAFDGTGAAATPEAAAAATPAATLAAAKAPRQTPAAAAAAGEARQDFGQRNSLGAQQEDAAALAAATAAGAAAVLAGGRAGGEGGGLEKAAAAATAAATAAAATAAGGAGRPCARASGPLFRPPLPLSLGLLRQGSSGLEALGLGFGEGQHGDAADDSCFTPLKLVEAYSRLDAVYRLSARHFLPPSKNECRNILNLAQVLALRDSLCLLTLDGDETLYPDGENFTHADMGRDICGLLKKGIAVAVVTGAGYGYESAKYAERLGILFDIFQQEKLSPKAAGRFFVMGGESNYLLRLSPSLQLEPVPEELWRHFRPPVSAADCERLLDVAERSLVCLSHELGLDCNLIRKQRAVGLVPRDDATNRVQFGCVDNKGMHKETLEEGVMRVRRDIRKSFEGDSSVPYSVFTGGCDIWVDAGNKAEGVAMLQGLLSLKPQVCLHVGDQFGLAGNDLAARICSPTLWIRSPKETAAVIKELLREKEGSPTAATAKHQTSPPLKSHSQQ